MGAWLGVYAFATKGAVFCLGLVVLYYVTRAASHSDDGGLWFLSVGIALTGLGLLLGDVLPVFASVDAYLAMGLTGTVSAVGLLAVIYSLFTDSRLTTVGGE